MKLLRDILICGVLLVGIALGMQAVAFLSAAQASLETAQTVANTLPVQVAALRADLTLEARATRKEALRQVDLLRRDVTALTAKAEVDAIAVIDGRTAELTATIDARSAEMVAVIEPATRTLERLDAIAAQAQETSDLLLACEGNPQCFANRSIGTMQAVEKFAQTGERTMRSIDAATPAVVADVHRATEAGVESAQATAGLMKNLEAQSKPLPLALRFAPQAIQAILLTIGVLK